MKPNPLSISLWGTFRMTVEERDCTPGRMKECGLVALLALSPQMRRTRAWLQAVLWSDAESQQAQTSLRRALSNLRKSLGDASSHLCADRHSIWLQPSFVNIEPRPAEAGLAFLASLVITDEAFEDWRRAQEAQLLCRDAPEMVDTPSATGFASALQIGLQVAQDSRAPEEAVLVEAFCLHLSRRLLGLGAVEIVDGTDPNAVVGLDCHVTVELRTFFTAPDLTLHLRLLHGPHRACFWADHLRLRVENPLAGPESVDMAACIGRAVNALSHKLPQRAQPALPACLRLQRVSELLFTGDNDRIETSENQLRRLRDEGHGGVVAGWHAFAKLTRALEFNETGADLVAEALELSQEGLLDARCSPVATALAAIVNMKLNDDFDYGYYLALKAHALCEHDPYALNALSQACFFKCDYPRAYSLARNARAASGGLPHSYYWDIQSCLAALGLGLVSEAREHAWQSHLRWPGCRPPLRYLTALSLLEGEHAAAAGFATKLRRLETGFHFGALLDAAYPMQTLRRAGLTGDLTAAIGIDEHQGFQAGS